MKSKIGHHFNKMQTWKTAECSIYDVTFTLLGGFRYPFKSKLPYLTVCNYHASNLFWLGTAKSFSNFRGKSVRTISASDRRRLIKALFKLLF